MYYLNNKSACSGVISTSSFASFAIFGTAFVMKRVKENFLPLAAIVLVLEMYIEFEI